MTRYTVYAILGGLIAGGAYLISLQGASQSIALSLIPSLTLFIVGIAYGVRPLFIALMVAAFLALLSVPIMFSMWFLLLTLVPVGMFCTQLLMFQSNGSAGSITWYPILTILSRLCLYVTGLFLLVSYGIATSEGGIEMLLGEETLAMLEESGSGFTQLMEKGVGNHLVLPVAFFLWIWMMLFYGLAAMAFIIVERFRVPIRSSLAMHYTRLPLSLLVALIGVALLGLLGSETVWQFSGRVLVITLLFPYFLNGLMMLHRLTLGWQLRRMWLGVIYVMTVLTIWPAIAFACWGVLDQCSRVLGISNDSQARKK